MFSNAFLASWFQLLGILRVVYVEFSATWPHSLCYSIALDYDARKSHGSPYAESIMIFSNCGLFSFWLISFKRFLLLLQCGLCFFFAASTAHIQSLEVDRRKFMSYFSTRRSITNQSDALFNHWKWYADISIMQTDLSAAHEYFHLPLQQRRALSWHPGQTQGLSRHLNTA